MKKFLSIILVLILMLSSKSSVFVTTLSAEESEGGPINYAPNNWQAGAHWYNNGGRVTETNDSHLGGKGFTVSSGSSAYQFVDATDTITLMPNTDYRFFISVKGLTHANKNLLEKVLVYTGGAREAAGNNESFPSAQWVASISNSVVDATSNNEWIRLYFDFTTNSSITYDLRLKWNNVSSFTISDIALYAKTTASVETSGNGDAFVSSAAKYVGESVSFNAVSGTTDSFIGWYDSSDNLLGTDAVLTIKTDSSKLDIFAKFSGTKPTNYDNGTWQASEHWKKNNGGTNGVVTSNDNHLGGAAYTTILSPAYQYIYASEVKLLPNTEYRISFSIKGIAKNTVNAFSIYNGGTLKNCTVETPPADQRIQYCATDISDTSLTTGEWIRLVYNFKTGDNTSYDFRINFGDISKFIISDITVNAKATTSAVIDGDGAATISSTVGYVGETVEFVAYPTKGESFLGWYSEENELLGEEIKLSKQIDKPDFKVVAKFTGSLAQNFAPSLWQSCAHWYNNGGRLSETNTSHFGGKAFAVTSGSANYQYVDAEQSITLNPNTQYRFGISVKGITTETKGLLEALIVYKGGTKIEAGNSETFPSDKRIAYVSVSTVDEVLSGNGWTRLYFDFTTTNETNYDLRLRWGNISTYILSDITLYAKGSAKAETNGNGTAEVSNSAPYVGQTVIYTATPKKGEEFLGWYLNDEKLSSNAIFAYQTNNVETVLTAKFSGTSSYIVSEDFEDYAEYHSFVEKATVKDENWAIASRHDLGWQNVQAINNAFEGNRGLMLASANSLVGRKVKGLQKNTDYLVSFYVKQPSAMGNTLDKILVLPSNVIPATVGGSELTNKSEDVLGYLENEVIGNDTWQKVEVLFNSGNNTDATVWIRYAAQGSPYELSLLYIDNFEVFKPVKVEKQCTNGGNISANFYGNYIAFGEEVILTASPFEGNSFDGWYDKNGNLVSEDAIYSFSAESNVNLKAVFSGYNMPVRDLFAEQGQDGTFENGSITGWYATDLLESGHDWCLFQRSDKYSYEGDNSLMLFSRYRDSVLPINGLNKNSDYHFSFYFNIPEECGEEGSIRNFGIIGINDTNVPTASVKYDTYTQIIEKGSGWYRADMYFNSGDAEAVNFVIRYYATDGYVGCYLDNISLVEYSGNAELINGDFSSNKEYWLGEGAVTGEGTLSLNNAEIAYQPISLKQNSSYTLNFRAKGELTATFNYVDSKDLNVKNQISSVSGIKTSGDWNNYSLNLFTDVHKAVNLVLSGNNAEIDDITLTENSVISGSIVEKIDFESERFSFIEKDGAYSLHNATDSNVYSGNSSMKFTVNANNNNICIEPFIAKQLTIGLSYKLTFYYKTNKGNSLILAPEFTKTLGGKDFTQIAVNNGWTKVEYKFINTKFNFVKFLISGIEGKTTADFYIDDITLQIAHPMILDKNINETYCESFYNAASNGDFENQYSADIFVNLPNTVKIEKSNSAISGKNLLTVSKGTKYVLKVAVSPATEYNFAVSIRGNASGWVGIATNDKAQKNALYYDSFDNPASFINITPNNTWKRSGFSFVSDTTGYVYLTIVCDSGTVELDDIMLFKSELAYAENPNDYSVIIPFDYNADNSDITVINGGIGTQNSYMGDDILIETDEDFESPSTGDGSKAIPILLIFITAVVLVLLTVIKRRDCYEK